MILQYAPHVYLRLCMSSISSFSILATKASVPQRRLARACCGPSGCEASPLEQLEPRKTALEAFIHLKILIYISIHMLSHSLISCYIMKYYTISILYYTISYLLYCVLCFNFKLYCIVLYCIVLYCIVLFCIVLYYCFISYYIMLYIL